MKWQDTLELTNLQELLKRAVGEWMLMQEQDVAHHLDQLVGTAELDLGSYPIPVAEGVRELLLLVPRPARRPLKQHFRSAGEEGNAQECALVESLLDLFELVTQGEPLE